MKKQVQILSIALFFFWGTIYAQQPQHEFSVSLGGGLSSLNYKPSDKGQKAGFGGQFGLGYRYFITPELSLGTGVEFALFNAKYNSKSFKTSYMAIDNEFRDEFEFRSVVNGFEEKQNTMLLQIPVMAQYQFGYIYAGGGFKVGIPLSKKFSNKASTLKNTGFYNEEIYEYTTQEFRGFGTFNDISSKGELDLKTAFFLSLEGGAKLPLNDNFLLYVGAYFDFGLNSISKKRQNTPLIEYNSANPTGFVMNSIVISQYSQVDSPSQAFIDKPLALGIKLRLAFGAN